MEAVVTTGDIRRAKLQSNRQHQQTNTQRLTGRMPFLLLNQQCQSAEWKIITFHRLETNNTRVWFYWTANARQYSNVCV